MPLEVMEKTIAAATRDPSATIYVTYAPEGAPARAGVAQFGDEAAFATGLRRSGVRALAQAAVVITTQSGEDLKAAGLPFPHECLIPPGPGAAPVPYPVAPPPKAREILQIAMRRAGFARTQVRCGYLDHELSGISAARSMRPGPP